LSCPIPRHCSFPRVTANKMAEKIVKKIGDVKINGDKNCLKTRPRPGCQVLFFAPEIRPINLISTVAAIVE
jgi:hypothetical protein